MDLQIIEVTMENIDKTNEVEDSHPADKDWETYELCIEGLLSPTWSDWFDGMTLINTEDGCSFLFGSVKDQAALHGILARIRDLNLKLILVRKV